MKGLVGLGASKEMKGPNTEWTPELYLGSEVEKKIADRQRLYARSIFLPDIGDFGEFRFRIRAGWEIGLNKSETLKLNVSMFDRYDSTPSADERKNDIDYWASISWSF